MPDLTPNNPENISPDNNDSNGNDLKYELITAYIDNRLSDSEKEEVKKSIESDNDLYNRYIFEKLTKETFQKRSVKIQTPVYLYKNIGKEIDEYIKKSSLPKIDSRQITADNLMKQASVQKSNLRRNLIYSTLGFIVLVAAVFLFYPYMNLNSNPDLRDNDLVSVSRSVFDKVKAGQVKLQYQSNNAKELTDSMNKHLDFKVYIPDVKEAVLVGGVCNEINGQKLAHFIHKKGTILIYTLEASKTDVLNNIDKIVLCDQFKQNVKDGQNWVPCKKENSKTTVIWFKDNVICATVSEMDHDEITSTLANLK